MVVLSIMNFLSGIDRQPLGFDLGRALGFRLM